MAKLIAQYQFNVPPLLVIREEELEPITLNTDLGRVILHAPESKDSKPNDYWNADTVQVALEIEVTSPLSEKEVNEVISKSNKEAHQIILQFLKLARRKLLVPMFIPTSLTYNANYKWEGWQPSSWIPLATVLCGVVQVVPQEGGLTRDRWQQIQEEMRAGIYTELWEDFVEDSKAALKEDDIMRAILYAAISCEIFMEEYTEKSAKKAGISQVFWKYLKNRQIRILDYFDSVLDLVIGHSLKTENRQLYSLLERLYEARNAIMHEGQLPPSWSESKISKLKEDVRDMERVISWVRELGSS